MDGRETKMKSWCFRTAVMLGLAVMMLLAPATRAVGAGYKPRQVMALMITKFTRYATWPTSDTVQDSSTVDVCLVTRDAELRGVFDQMLDNKKIGGEDLAHHGGEFAGPRGQVPDCFCGS